MKRRSLLAGLLGAIALGPDRAVAGFLSLRSRGVASPSTKLAPSAQWDGTPGSGFGGSNPAKPTYGTRTASRVALRPIFIQHTFITGPDAPDGSDWLVFAARGFGGVQKVRVWMEGNYIDLTTKRWVTYTDVRGTARKVYGFAVQADYAAAQAAHPQGRATVVAQGFSNNGAFQTQCSVDRIVHFRPGAALTAGSRYDEVKTVGSGGDYSTLEAAITYAIGQASTNPNKYIGIKIITNGEYNADSPTLELQVCQHATEIFAQSGVTATMGKTGGTTTLVLDGTRFYGPGIGIDTSSALNSSNVCMRVSNNPTAQRMCQFVGIEIYTGSGRSQSGYSGSGAGLLYNGFQPSVTWLNNLLTYGIGSSHAEFKDVNSHDMSSFGFVAAESIICCDLTDCSGSGFELCWGLIHGCSLTRIGGYQSGLRQQKAAITMAYGGGGTASYTVTTASNGSAPTSNGNFGFLNLYVGGVFQTSFNLTTYWNSSLLSAAINAYGNSFSCTFDATYADRATAYLSRAGLVPTDPLYPAVNFSAGSAALTTIYDIHADCMVFNTGTWTNIIYEFVEEYENVGTSPLSNDGDSLMYDVMYGDINAQDTSAANGISAQQGYWLGEWHHVGYENLNVSGSGAGAYIGNNPVPCDAYTFIKNSFFTTIFYTGTAYALMNWQGLVVNINSLPSGANSGNYSSVQSASQSTFIDLTTGVPVLNGALKNSNGDYCCAKCPTSLRVDSPTGNYGWLLAA